MLFHSALIPYLSFWNGSIVLEWTCIHFALTSAVCNICTCIKFRNIHVHGVLTTSNTTLINVYCLFPHCRNFLLQKNLGYRDIKEIKEVQQTAITSWCCSDPYIQYGRAQTSLYPTRRLPLFTGATCTVHIAGTILSLCYCDGACRWTRFSVVRLSSVLKIGFLGTVIDKLINAFCGKLPIIHVSRPQLQALYNHIGKVTLWWLWDSGKFQEEFETIGLRFIWGVGDMFWFFSVYSTI